MTRRRLGLQSVRHVLADLRCLLRYAAELEEIPVAPSFRAVLPRIPEEAPDRLSDEEVDRILAVLPPQHKFSVRLALLTGLRYGELHRLRWRDVRWDPDPALILEKTKSKKVRRVPLSSEAVGLLKTAYQHKRSFYVVESRAKTAGNIYKRSAEKCGFRWRFHQLRHTFACRYLEAGGTPAALKEILGHSTIKLTERYSRLSEKAVFEEARNVDLRTTSGHQSGHHETAALSQELGSQ